MIYRYDAAMVIPSANTPIMLEGTAVSGPVSASDDQFRHHCENHSPGSFPHPDGDVSRQVSWLALPRLSRLPRLFHGPVAFGKASALTVAGAATVGAEAALPYSLLTPADGPAGHLEHAEDVPTRPGSVNHPL